MLTDEDAHAAWINAFTTDAESDTDIFLGGLPRKGFRAKQTEQKQEQKTTEKGAKGGAEAEQEHNQEQKQKMGARPKQE